MKRNRDNSGDEVNNTFAIGDGLSNPEGLDTGGSSSCAEDALAVGPGVALPGEGTVPALGVVEEEVQGAGPASLLVTHRHFHEHPATQWSMRLGGQEAVT